MLLFARVHDAVKNDSVILLKKVSVRPMMATFLQLNSKFSLAYVLLEDVVISSRSSVQIPDNVIVCPDSGHS